MDAPWVERKLDSAWSTCALALGGLRGEVLVLEDRQQLPGLHVVAAVGVELLHRRRDLGHHVLLVQREQHAIAGHDAADGVLGHRGDLDGRGRFHLLLLLSGAGAETTQHDMQQQCS